MPETTLLLRAWTFTRSRTGQFVTPPFPTHHLPRYTPALGPSILHCTPAGTLCHTHTHDSHFQGSLPSGSPGFVCSYTYVLSYCAFYLLPDHHHHYNHLGTVLSPCLGFPFPPLLFPKHTCTTPLFTRSYLVHLPFLLLVPYFTYFSFLPLSHTLH